MSDLLTWLRVQLDEDERLADLAGGAAGFRWVITDDDPETPGRVEDDQGRIIIWDHEARLSGHIGRHSPARVLAEIEAKRQILDLHGFTDDGWNEGEDRRCTECG